jgi:hypothetical protein
LITAPASINRNQRNPSLTRRLRRRRSNPELLPRPSRSATVPAKLTFEAGALQTERLRQGQLRQLPESAGRENRRHHNVTVNRSSAETIPDVSCMNGALPLNS